MKWIVCMRVPTRILPHLRPLTALKQLVHKGQHSHQPSTLVCINDDLQNRKAAAKSQPANCRHIPQKKTSQPTTTLQIIFPEYKFDM